MTPAANYDIIPIYSHISFKRRRLEGDEMLEKRQFLILKLIKIIISPEDILTEKDIADIEQARAEYARGEAMPASTINWD